jgi:PleD family two-component response regulator
VAWWLVAFVQRFRAVGALALDILVSASREACHRRRPRPVLFVHRMDGAAMRVVIAEDDALLREGLAALLRAEGFDVATHPDADRLYETVEEYQASLAIIDVRMPPT